VSDRLVAVHGQSDQHRLLRPVAQRRALDRFAASGVAVLLDEYRPAYERWRAVDALLRELIEQAADREREVEQLRYGLEQVEAVAPRPGEDTDLRLEEDRLANAEALQAATARAHACISGGDDADADATTLLSTARQLLDSEREHDPSVAELSDRASDLAYQLADLGVRTSPPTRPVWSPTRPDLPPSKSVGRRWRGWRASTDPVMTTCWRGPSEHCDGSRNWRARMIESRTDDRA
jgi:DNA repair protein RecN (Recombination protein N)